MSPSPWCRTTLLLALGGNLLGLLGVIAAWYGASGELTMQAQVRWLNLGVVSLVVAGTATVALLREARIRVTDETRRLLVRLRVNESEPS